MGEPAVVPCAFPAGMVAARLCLAHGHTAMPFGLGPLAMAGITGLRPWLGGLLGGPVGDANACLEDMPVLAVLQCGVFGVPRALALDVHQCNIAVLLREGVGWERDLSDFSKFAEELLDLPTVQSPHSLHVQMERPELRLLHGLDQFRREGIDVPRGFFLVGDESQNTFMEDGMKVRDAGAELFVDRCQYVCRWFIKTGDLWDINVCCEVAGFCLAIKGHDILAVRWGLCLCHNATDAQDARSPEA